MGPNPLCLVEFSFWGFHFVDSYSGFACHGLGFSLWFFSYRGTIIHQHAVSCLTSLPLLTLLPLPGLPCLLHIPHQSNEILSTLGGPPSNPSQLSKWLMKGA